jgi:hypothetical protein
MVASRLQLPHETDGFLPRQARDKYKQSLRRRTVASFRTRTRAGIELAAKEERGNLCHAAAVALGTTERLGLAAVSSNGMEVALLRVSDIC